MLKPGERCNADTSGKRVLLAGLYHESHSFLPPTGWEAFTCYEEDAVFSRRGDGSPVDGFLEVAGSFGWEVLPSIYMQAMPSGVVEDEVFERFWCLFENSASRLIAGKGVDAVFLVLHGAMVTQRIADVEGEFLQRLRRLPGLSSVPLFGVLDLHANFSEKMARHASALLAYRENPHVDARDTAIRAAILLQACLAGSDIPSISFRPGQLILPAIATGSDDDPMRALLRMAEALRSQIEGILAINVTAGFAYADTPDTGLAFSVIHSGVPERAEACLERLFQLIHQLSTKARKIPLFTPKQALALKPEGGPLLLVESSDNIGAGTFGDSTTLLRGLLSESVQKAVFVLNDAQAVLHAREVPVGKPVSLEVGGRINPFDPGPLRIEGILRRRGDGAFMLEDPRSHLASMTGNRVDMGPCLVIQAGGTRLLVTSRPTPPFDLGQLRSQGIEPRELDYISLKSAVGHRQAYSALGGREVFLDTPGPCPADLRRLPYRSIQYPFYPLES